MVGCAAVHVYRFILKKQDSFYIFVQSTQMVKIKT